MCCRALFFLICFLAGPPFSLASDDLTLSIRQFGLGGAISYLPEPIWLQLSVKSNSPRPLSFRLKIQQLDLNPDAVPWADTINSPQSLEPSAERILDVPVNLASADPRHSVLYIQAVATDGTILARTARVLGEPTQGHVLALLCGTPAICSK